MTSLDWNNVHREQGPDGLQRVFDDAATKGGRGPEPIRNDKPPSDRPGLRVDTLEEFAVLDLPKRECVLAPVLPIRGLGMLVAQRGVGKTHIALGMAYAASTALPFLRWSAPKPRRVLYVDGEMPAEAFLCAPSNRPVDKRKPRPGGLPSGA